MKRVDIDPITRLEGHGKISIFINDEGSVENAYLQIPELRGFEKFVEGVPIEEVSRIVPRICGVCPAAHHMAAGKAADAVYNVDIPPVAKKLRELYYMAHFIHSHAAHFYALAAPDFVLGPDAPKAQRNVLGLIDKVGLEIGREVLRQRAISQDIQILVGGRATHPVWNIPGGVTRALSVESRDKVKGWAAEQVQFAEFSLKLFNDVVLSNKKYLDLIMGDVFEQVTNYMGLVDENNRVNFYQGQVRVVDTTGQEIIRYSESQYLDHVAEHVEPYSYLKYPYLKERGWNGFVEGQGTSLYQANPLPRLNAADGMATPKAQAEYEKMFETVGGKPCHKLLVNHWARLVEVLYAAERMEELINDEEITDPHVRVIPSTTPREGVGIVEAPRGTLTHHYWTDENGIVTKANLIVGTTNNNASISMAIKKVAQNLIKPGGEVSDGLLNTVEMAFRLYDPCFSCATHSLPGQMPLTVEIKNTAGETLNRISR
ncbi:MAG: Ni/Fe hydrogenase subunit alpha [Candidatus Krumholzibacteriota bacterium]|nr:Ni/Fe hydrogenase subunit alpha [Candidatus Krumholzibacteriota bacterium]